MCDVTVGLLQREANRQTGLTDEHGISRAVGLTQRQSGAGQQASGEQSQGAQQCDSAHVGLDQQLVCRID